MKNPVVITTAKRTPIGHFNGVFKDVSATQLGADAIAALLQKNVAQVLMGCVLPAGLGQAPARQAALSAGLSDTTPCVTLNKMCGSGLQTILCGVRELQHNPNQIIIAGGMENMSRAPYLMPGARFGYRFGNHTVLDHLLLDGLTNAYGDHLSMGAIADVCAKKNNITRAEQDAFALRSYELAKQATQKGLFKTEIAPVNTIFEDEGIHRVIPDKIPLLKPAFAKEGTITAANASSISDGAAAVSLTTLSYAEKQGEKPLAIIVGDVVVAGASEDFPIAPVIAIEKLCEKINWAIKEVDLFEINEAFSVVPLIAMKKLSIPREKINVHGGACVLGHPIGASGARIVVTLIHALIAQQKKRGIAAICIGGGEAIALAVEIL